MQSADDLAGQLTLQNATLAERCTASAIRAGRGGPAKASIQDGQGPIRSRIRHEIELGDHLSPVNYSPRMHADLWLDVSRVERSRAILGGPDVSHLMKRVNHPATRNIGPETR